VSYTEISAYEPKASATTVYSGRFSIVSASNGGEMTINFDTTYTYHGGNLLVGVENTETNGWKGIGFKGQTVNGASISGNSSSTNTIPAEQQNFISKTTFSYIPGASSTVTQTIELAQGWNWVSFNVETTLDDLKAALVDALGNTRITINSQQDGNTTFYGTMWRGSLNSLDVAQTYLIKTELDCEISLTGSPLNPIEHPITILNGFNWIGFPLNAEMGIGQAFAGFAVSGDILSGQVSFANYNGSTWRGVLNRLEPGKGYMYKSSVTGSRVFTFPTNTK
jgi:hypothetical protein